MRGASERLGDWKHVAFAAVQSAVVPGCGKCAQLPLRRDGVRNTPERMAHALIGPVEQPLSSTHTTELETRKPLDASMVLEVLGGDCW